MKNLIGAGKDEWITMQSHYLYPQDSHEDFKACILVERLPIFAVALFRTLLL